MRRFASPHDYAMFSLMMAMLSPLPRGCRHDLMSAAAMLMLRFAAIFRFSPMMPTLC